MASILNVDKIRANGSTTDGITIDSSGRVEFPARPYIFALHSDNHSYTSGETVDQWNIKESRGITESSGVFTVPVDGLYQISLSALSTVSGQGISFYHNSTDLFRIAYFDNSPAHEHAGSSFAMILTANDTVKMLVDGAMTLYGASGSNPVGCFSMVHLG